MKHAVMIQAVLCVCLLGFVPVGGQDIPRDTLSRASRKILSPQTDTVPSPLFLTPENFYGEAGMLFDTLLEDAHEYDPARTPANPCATLGNLGSPARELYFHLPQPKGLHSGQAAFDLYKTRFETFRFYDTDIGLTRLAYSQGLNQDDAIFRAQFGRNFDKGINLSLNYQRINQVGQFRSQRAKNTAFGIAILYRAPKGKLDGIYHYQSNSIIHEENGGVDLLALDTIDLNLNIPVTLTGALTTHRARQLSVQHHVHLLGRVETADARKAQIDLIHVFQSGSELIKFADASLTDNTRELSYYDGFVTDSRGMRHFLWLHTIDNHFDIQFRYRERDSAAPAQILRAGLQYRRTKINQEPLNSRAQEVFLNFSGQLGISKHIVLNGQGYIGILDAAENYRLRADAKLKIFDDAHTSATLILYQRKPNLTEQRLFVNQIAVWETDFKNLNLSSLHFHYDHPSLRLRIHGGLHTLSNLIYYDAQRLPQQLELSVEILQMTAAKEISVGPVGLFGQIMLQQYDAEEIALPHLILQSQLFYTGRWFQKRLLVRTGLDLFMTDNYPGISWFPVTGQFYYDPQFNISQYPALDVFFNMQVKDFFRAFVKVENITAFVRDEHFIQVGGYPIFERYFRFGLWMKLAD